MSHNETETLMQLTDVVRFSDLSLLVLLVKYNNNIISRHFNTN